MNRTRKSGSRIGLPQLSRPELSVTPDALPLSTGTTATYTAGGNIAPVLRGIVESATNTFSPTLRQHFHILTADGAISRNCASLFQPSSDLYESTKNGASANIQGESVPAYDVNGHCNLEFALTFGEFRFDEEHRQHFVETGAGDLSLAAAAGALELRTSKQMPTFTCSTLLTLLMREAS